MKESRHLHTTYWTFWLLPHKQQQLLYQLRTEHQGSFRTLRKSLGPARARLCCTTEGGWRWGANSITSSLQQPGRTEWGEEEVILNDRIRNSSYPPTAHWTHPTGSQQKQQFFNIKTASFLKWRLNMISRRHPTVVRKLSRAEPCKLSRETLNIHTVAQKTGWLLWRHVIFAAYGTVSPPWHQQFY